MTLIRATRGSTPRDVLTTAAQVAADAARRLDFRLWTQYALAPHVPHAPMALDPQGRWAQAAIAAWARTVAPLREPVDVGELVAAPWRTIATRTGDCDDVAAAAAAMAAVVGLPAGVAVYDTSPGFAHIVAVIGDDWTPEADLGPDNMLAIDQAGARPLPALPPSTTIAVVRR